MKIDLKKLKQYEPHKRLAKNYGITEEQLQQIILMINTDFSLGRYKYAKTSDRFYMMTGKYISRRQIRYAYYVCKNYEDLYNQLKRGGYIVDSLYERIYKNS